jgi:hypothetical protein
MKSGLESMLQSIKERKSMAGLSMSAFSSAVSSTSGGIGAPAVSMPSSYASAAANALNNNIAVGSLSGGSAVGGIVTIGALGPQPLASNSGGSATISGTSGNLVLKNVQSLAYCYAIDCKSSYEELNRVMRVINLILRFINHST